MKVESESEMLLSEAELVALVECKSEGDFAMQKTVQEDEVVIKDPEASCSRRRRNTERYIMALTLTSLVFLISTAISLGFFCLLSQAAVCLDQGCLKTSASILSAMNQSAEPCQDFYEYSCGGWLDSVDIPAGHVKWNTFQIVEQSNKKALKKLLERGGTRHKGQESSAYRKVKDYYAACMDFDGRQIKGAQPLIDLIKDYGGWPVLGDDTSTGGWNSSVWTVTGLIAKLHKISIYPFFFLYVGTDDRDSSKNIIQIEQSGLGLQFPEMYNSSDTLPILNAYLKLSTQVIGLLHNSEECMLERRTFSDHVQENMQAVIDFETKMSALFVPKSELQDPTAIYNKMQLKDFQDLISAINLTEYFTVMFGENVPAGENVIIYTPAFFPLLNDLLKNTPDRVIADYMIWQMIQPFLTHLSEDFESIFRDFQQVVSGTRDLPPLWHRCTARTDDIFGFATGAMFVEDVHNVDINEEAEELIEGIRRAFIDNLPHVGWMDDETRTAAEEKAEAMSAHVGYPRWIDNPAKLDKYYEKAEISRDCMFNNFRNVRSFTLEKMLSHRGTPTNSSRWELTPATVNAYYTPAFNQIVFPSGIFQYPFYHQNNLRSMNYGGIGMVMGHELTHGFDNNGRKYDKDGNMNEWWEEAAAVAYEEQTRCMVHQYSRYHIDGVHVDGEYTLPENIADNGGLKLAFKAFQEWKVSNADAVTQLPGIDLNSDQLFFLGFSQIWCSYQTPEYAKLAALSDPHTNDRYRVIGALSNSLEFAAAFNCELGSDMNPMHKCQVW